MSNKAAQWSAGHGAARRAALNDRPVTGPLVGDFGLVSDQLQLLGSLVESQIRRAIYALSHADVTLSAQIVVIEREVNALAARMDGLLCTGITPQPLAAVDLRWLTASFKVTANLERVGDEAERMAGRVRSLDQGHAPPRLPALALRTVADLVASVLHKALNAFARLDPLLARSLLTDDALIDQALDGFMRKLLGCMVNDPRTISSCLDWLFVAKALERIREHAQSIAELVMEVVRDDGLPQAAVEEVAALPSV